MQLLVHLPGTWFKRVWQTGLASKAQLMKVLFDDMKATWVSGLPRGIADIFFDEQTKEGCDWLNDDNAKSVFTDLVIGVTVSLFFIHYPDVMKNIQAEIDEVVGPRWPRLEDRRRCNYTEAAILEALRTFTLLPFGVDHVVREDVQFRGFTIPKDTQVLPSLWCINNAEEVWGDPDTFRPERFLDDKGELLEATHPVRQQLMIFGAGKRACPGESFARARIFLYVSTLLQRFDILPPEGEKLPPLGRDSFYMGGIASVNPYRCVFRERKCHP
ncbi:hypothetical protein BaRGS_00035319 [Batillaria attramentaria]|uniref:Cytochrome P450 n=1 Tax=Batillaria attramentaria TaxID=370345 RepID=A0ABD0JF39_9CAEN